MRVHGRFQKGGETGWINRRQWEEDDLRKKGRGVWVDVLLTVESQHLAFGEYLMYDG